MHSFQCVCANDDALSFIALAHHHKNDHKGVLFIFCIVFSSKELNENLVLTDWGSFIQEMPAWGNEKTGSTAHAGLIVQPTVLFYVLHIHLEEDFSIF